MMIERQLLLKFFLCYETFFFSISVIMLLFSCEINGMIIVLYLLWNSSFEIALGLSLLFLMFYARYFTIIFNIFPIFTFSAVYIGIFGMNYPFAVGICLRKYRFTFYPGTDSSNPTLLQLLPSYSYFFYLYFYLIRSGCTFFQH